MPRVSVIIPTHNRATLVARAVRSALAQTYSDLEVLVVDDASTDDTREMLLRIGDARVRYLRHDTNRGVSAARNTALAHLSGELVAFLDDDDEWLPEKLRLQMELVDKVDGRVGLISCGHYDVDHATAQIRKVILPDHRGWVLERLLRQGHYSHTSTVVARAECFARVGLFDRVYRYGEDYDMWLRIARDYQADFVREPLVRRYAQPTGLSQNLDAIVAAKEALLAKYRDFYETEPHIFSRRLQMLGVYYCFAGRMKEGRRSFRRAIGRRPLGVKSYLYAALSLTGPRAFRTSYRVSTALKSARGVPV